MNEPVKITRNVEIRMKKIKNKNAFDLKLHHVYEALFSVYDRDGLPHHAPIGVRVLGIHDGEKYELESRIFPTAKMYAELSRQKECTIHFPGYHQLQYYFLAFHEELKDQIVNVVKIVSKANSIDAPVIPDIKNYVEARVISIRNESIRDELSLESQGSSRRGVFSLESTRIIVNDPESMPVSRHGGLILEFMVKASRLRYLNPGSEKFMETRDELKNMLDKLESLAPGDEKNTMAATILDRIDHEK